MSYSGPDLK